MHSSTHIKRFQNLNSPQNSVPGFIGSSSTKPYGDKTQKTEKIDFIENYDAGPATEDLDLPLEATERKMLINEALDRLPPDESLVLRLFYLEECSIKEVETITGFHR